MADGAAPPVPPAAEPSAVESLIVVVRGERVILAHDLAGVYGVETRVLNQAVKRNRGRFPPDFAFRITREETAAILRSRSQSVILKRGQNVKYPPLAFTEHGAVMAATVLGSRRAIDMSIFVVRAFLHLRRWVASHAELSDRLADLEQRVGAHDAELRAIIQAIRRLVEPNEDPSRRQIGFEARREGSVVGRQKRRRPQ